MGSIDSELPLARQTTYAATKAGVLSMGRSRNAELHLNGEDGLIKVATIMPWAVDTTRWIHAANYSGHQPRMVTMDDPTIDSDAIVRACIDPQQEIPVVAKAATADVSHGIFPELTERLAARCQGSEAWKAGPSPPTSGSSYEPMQEGSGIGGGIRERIRQQDRAATGRR